MRKERIKSKSIRIWEELQRSLNPKLSFYIRGNWGPGRWHILAKVSGSWNSRDRLESIFSDNKLTVFYPPLDILPNRLLPIHQLSHHLELLIPLPWFSYQGKKALILLENMNLTFSGAVDINLNPQTQVSKKHCLSLSSIKQPAPSCLAGGKFNPRDSWVLSSTLQVVPRFWVSESAKSSGWLSVPQAGPKVLFRCHRSRR